ncbi:hypothetical protein BESB_070950 [Besnoitia besnoiti]|uniref:Transcription elongation factor SPT6 n=1 Tax=Besnoitia besnoiti TaxID=94643 RepID=A0A2A9ME46_BESBE|nr:uncharacterized protein BESB_070950 [Besnoitia besnoiti]PFH33943.1 hypothetical protein BESB_070950 [Besnoitia besnoiti]
MEASAPDAPASPAARSPPGDVEEGSAPRRLKRPSYEDDEDEPLRVSEKSKKKKKLKKREKKRDRQGAEKKRKRKKKRSSSATRKKKRHRFLKDSAREGEEEDEDEERRRRVSDRSDSEDESEEEESASDEEAEIAKEMKGFIVSEEDESGDEEEGESDDSEKDDNEEGLQQLDEEDLALIEENTGLTVRKQPLRPPGVEDESADEEAGETQDGEAGGGRADAAASFPAEERRYRRLKKQHEPRVSKTGGVSEAEGQSERDDGHEDWLFLDEDKGENRLLDSGEGSLASPVTASALEDRDGDRTAGAAAALVGKGLAPAKRGLLKKAAGRFSAAGAREDRADVSDEDEEAWLEEEDALRESSTQQRMGETWGLVYDCFGDVEAVVRILCNQRPPRHAWPRDGEEDDLQAGDSEFGDRAARRRRDALLGDCEDEESEEARARSGRVDRTGGRRLPGKPGSRRGDGWEAIGEPDEVKREFLTAFDEQVRRADEPERLYLRFLDRPKTTSKAALVLESKWITTRLFREFGAQLTEEELQKRYFDSFFEGCRLRRSPQHDVRQKVILLLDWVLNERLEIVFILHHKLHLLAPPLTEEMIWRVYELDQQYARFLAKKRKIFELIEEVVDGVALLQGARQSEEARQRLLQTWALCTEKRDDARSGGRGLCDGSRRAEDDFDAADQGDEIALEDFRTFLHAHYRQFIATAREALQKKLLAEDGDAACGKREAGEEEDAEDAGDRTKASRRAAERQGPFGADGTHEEEEDDGLGLSPARRAADRNGEGVPSEEEPDAEKEEEDWLVRQDDLAAASPDAARDPHAAEAAAHSAYLLMTEQQGAGASQLGGGLQLDPSLPLPPPPEELLQLSSQLPSAAPALASGARRADGAREEEEADASAERGDSVADLSEESGAAPLFRSDAVLNVTPPFSPSSFLGPRELRAEAATPIEAEEPRDGDEGAEALEARRGSVSSSLIAGCGPAALSPRRVSASMRDGVCTPAARPSQALFADESLCRASPSGFPHDREEEPVVAGDGSPMEEEEDEAPTQLVGGGGDAPASSAGEGRQEAEHNPREGAGEEAPAPTASAWKSRWGVQAPRPDGERERAPRVDAGDEREAAAYRSGREREGGGRGWSQGDRVWRREDEERERRWRDEGAYDAHGGAEGRRSRPREREDAARGGEERLRERREEDEREYADHRRRDRDDGRVPPSHTSSDSYYGDRERGSRRRSAAEDRGGREDYYDRQSRSGHQSWWRDASPLSPRDRAERERREGDRECENEGRGRLRGEDELAEASEAAEWAALEQEALEEERKLVLEEREEKFRRLLHSTAAGEQPGLRVGVGLREIPGLEAIELADRYNIFSLWEAYLLPPDAFVSNLEALSFASCAFSPSLFASRFSALLRPTETPHIPIASGAALSSVLTYAASSFLSQFVPHLFLNASPDLPHSSLEKLPRLPVETVENLEAAGDAWCTPFCVHPFDSGKQLKRVLVAYYAKILASYPPLRSLIRKRFHQICSLSTLTTVKGEAETDPAKPCWLARRLCRLPLLKFINGILPSFEEAPAISPWKDRARRKAEEEARKAEQREHLKKLVSLEEKRKYLEEVQNELRREEDERLSPAEGSMTRARRLETLLKKRQETRCTELFLQVYRLEKAGEVGLYIHPQTSVEQASSRFFHQKEFEERHRDFRRMYRSLVIDKGREAPALEALAMNKTAADAFGTGVGASLVFDLVKQKRFLDAEQTAFLRSRAQDAFLVQRLIDELLAAYSPHLWQASTSAGNIGSRHFAAFFSEKARNTQRSLHPGVSHHAAGGPRGAGAEEEGESFTQFLQRSGGNVSAANASSAMAGWLHIQREILRRVVEAELFPIFKREVREELLQRAQQVVVTRCREMLEWRLNTQPLRPSPEQIRKRQQRGDDDGEKRSKKARRKRGEREHADARMASSSDEEDSDFFGGEDSDSSSGSSSLSSSSEASSSSGEEDEDAYAVSGAFQTERKRQKAARRQRKLQKQQRLLERKRRLFQEPALVEVLSFVIEHVHQDISAELTNCATVGSAVDTPGVARNPLGAKRRSRVRVHAMLVNAWGEMDEYDVYEFLLNAPLPSQRDLDEAAQTGNQDLSQADATNGQVGAPRPTVITPEQRRAHDDFERLLRFFKDHFIDAAVVGVRDRFALLLYLILKERLLPKLKKKAQPLFLELASLEVPIIWAGSDKVPPALKQKLDREGLMCLSLARSLQDPLAEIAGLWSEGRQNSLLQLKLHPLQKLVPSDRLQSALERVLLTAVGKVGVELKRALRGGSAALGGNPSAALLQFVPGLGPRKAARLLSMFKSSTLLMRSQLCAPNDGGNSDSDSGGGGRGDLDDFHPSQVQSEKRQSQPVGLGRQVYMNCVSFLRLKNKTSDPESVDALDDTRIHPLEGRSFVAKICRDAVAEKEEGNANGEEEGGEQGGDGGTGRRDDEADDDDAIVEVFKKPSLLDDMDLEAFSQMLAQTEEQARSLPYLEFITSELRHPYRDPRLPFESASEMEVFFWAVNEDMEDFHAGSSVSCQVVFVRNTSLVVRLQPSGIRVQLSDLRELRSLLALRTQVKRENPELEQRPYEDLSPLLGEVLHGRIAFLHYGIELERSGFPTYCVEVVVTGDVVKAMVAQNLVADISLNSVHAYLSPAARFDGLAVRRPLTVELDELQLQQQKQRQRVRRNIRHPNYKPVTPLKGLQLLQRAEVPVGEALFRPGTSAEGLTLMVKTCSEPFRCLSLPVEERHALLAADKSPEGLAAALQQQEQLGGVGSELILQGEKFDSLNAIIAQFCDPLRVNLEEVFRHPKYLPIPDLALAAEKLRQEAASRPGSIMWALLPPAAPAPAVVAGRDPRNGTENPLRFQLVVLPPQPPQAAAVGGAARVLVDGIYVDHKKFSLWNQEHKSLQKLVCWWKEKGYWRRQELLKAYAEEKARLQEERNRKRQEREHLKMLEEKREEEERTTQRQYVATYIQPRNEQSAKEWYERALRRQKNYEPRAAGTVVENALGSSADRGGRGGERRTPNAFPGGGDAYFSGPYTQGSASLHARPSGYAGGSPHGRGEARSSPRREGDDFGRGGRCGPFSAPEPFGSGPPEFAHAELTHGYASGHMGRGSRSFYYGGDARRPDDGRGSGYLPGAHRGGGRDAERTSFERGDREREGAWQRDDGRRNRFGGERGDRWGRDRDDRDSHRRAQDLDDDPFRHGL